MSLFWESAEKSGDFSRSNDFSRVLKPEFQCVEQKSSAEIPVTRYFPLCFTLEEICAFPQDLIQNMDGDEQLLAATSESPPPAAESLSLAGLMIRAEPVLCAVCSELTDEPFKIEKIFAGTYEKSLPNLVLGSLQDLRSRQSCPLCRLTRQILLADREVRNNPDGVAFLVHRALPPSFLVIYRLQEQEPYKGTIQLLEINSPEGPPPSSIVRDPTTLTSTANLRALQTGGLNYDLISSWMNACHTLHGPECNEVHSNSLQVFDMILIDVVGQRLVTLPSDTRYFALSYVWGTAKSFNTTQATVEALKVSGALADTSIPKTLRDAMELTVRLGEKYLWVDALCIIQDDEEGKMDLILKMDIIYNQALLTVVALSGEHADAGLPGVSKDSRSPIGPLEHFPTSGNDTLSFTIQHPGLGLKVKDSVYATRGWTYQERLLSPRRLYLTESQAYFHCNCAIYEEQRGMENRSNFLSPGLMDDGMAFDLPSGWIDQGGNYRLDDGQYLLPLAELHNPLLSTQGEFPIPPLGARLFARGPTGDTTFVISSPDGGRDRMVIYEGGNGSCDPVLSSRIAGRENQTWMTGVDKYTRIVEQFTDLQLTEPGDILHAFSGVANTMAGMFGGDMTCGLPQQQFDLSLLWAPAGFLSWRERDRNGELFRVPFPTWSWAAWQGQVKYYHRDFEFYSDLLLGEVETFWVEKNGSFLEILRGDFPPNPRQGTSFMIHARCTVAHGNLPVLRLVPTGLATQVLHFRAQVLDASLFELKAAQSWQWPPTDPDAQIPYARGFHMEAFQEKHAAPRITFGHRDGTAACGILLMQDPDFSWPTEGEGYKMVLLSRWRQNINWASAEAETTNDFNGDWAIANIMLIKVDPQGIGERVAIGMMKISSWILETPRWGYICLL